MSKNHLKRLAAPKTWQIKRKGERFITKTMHGPHSLDLGMPLDIVLKESLSYASTTREVKKILGANEIRIDGKVRKDIRFPVGVFDTIEFPSINQYFRVVLSNKGKINLIKISREEALLKPCKIIGKKMVRGKLQLNLMDGKNIFVGVGNYKVNDTLLLSLPEFKIDKHLRLDKKAAVFLTGGKHIGEIGVVEDIVGNKIIYKNQQGDLIETSKKYAYVVGDTRPLIKLD